MSIALNKIHYAITIKTDYPSGIPEIGLDTDGYFRFTTDGYSPTQLDFYEDGTTNVTGVWYGDNLSKNGIKTSSQSIDIITGGDYAYLSGMSIELVNFNQLHKKMLGTQDLYIIGAEMTMYIIIDKIWYKRWVGVVSETKFNENTFTFIGKDKNNSENTALEDFSFGRSYSKYKNEEGTSAEKTESILDNRSIVYSKIQNLDTDSHIPQDYTGQPTIINEGYDQYVSDSFNWFNGFSHYYDYRIVANNSNTKFIYFLSGNLKDTIKTGMVAKFGTEDLYYSIEEVTLESYVYNGKTIYRTGIKINEHPLTIKNFDQYYGAQPPAVTNATIIDTTGKFTKDGDSKIPVTIYESIFTVYKKTDETFVQTDDGKFVAVDSNGDTVFVSGSLDPDGNLIITDNSSQVFKKCENEVYYTPLTTEKLSEITTGTAKNLESLSWQGISFENDLNTDSTFIKTQPEAAHAYKVDFGIPEGSTEEFIPTLLMKSLVDAKMVWMDRFQRNGSYNPNTDPNDISWGPYRRRISHYFGTAYHYFIDVSEKTQIFDSEIGSDEELMWNILADQFSVEIYALYNTDEWGEVAEFVQSFNVINSMNVTNRVKDPRWGDSYMYQGSGTAQEIIDLPQYIYLESVAVTNMKTSNIKGTQGKVLSRNAVVKWLNSDVYSYPNGIFDLSESAPISGKDRTYTLTPTGKYLVVIAPLSDYNTIDCQVYGWKSFNNVTVGANENGQTRGFDRNVIPKASIAINSLGSYKETTLTLDDFKNLSFKTQIESTDTLPELLGELTNTTVTLPTRSNWNVGGYIENMDNKYNLITKLCKQSFVGGWTNRIGETKFKDWINDATTAKKFDDEFILKNSIKDFSLTPIEKCYNEFTVKFHKVENDYKKTLGVYNVDKDVFPEPTSTLQVWSDYLINTSAEQSVLIQESLVRPGQYVLTVDIRYSPEAWNMLVENSYDLYSIRLEDVVSTLFYGTLEFKNVRPTLDPIVVVDENIMVLDIDIVNYTSYQLLSDVSIYAGMELQYLEGTDQYNPVWGTTEPMTYVTANHIKTTNPDITLSRFNTPPPAVEAFLRDLSHNLATSYKLVVNLGGTEYTIMITNCRTRSDDFLMIIEYDTLEGTYVNSALTTGNVVSITPAINNDNPKWETYVVGVKDYNSAKAIWEKAHASWKTNKRIRTIPDERVNLEYAIDLDEWNGSGYTFNTPYCNQNEYGFKYFDQLVDWTTQQKYQVNFKVPLSQETIKYEILDPIEFEDVLITPDAGEYWKGWITSIQVDPKDSLLNIGITFEPDFLKIRPVTIGGDIIETGYNIIDIIETGSNSDNIFEDGGI